MDSFPSKRAAKLSEMRAKQDAIVGLLDRINKLQVSEGVKLMGLQDLVGGVQGSQC
jgi:hypothetical protein